MLLLAMLCVKGLTSVSISSEVVMEQSGAWPMELPMNGLPPPLDQDSCPSLLLKPICVIIILATLATCSMPGPSVLWTAYACTPGATMLHLYSCKLPMVAGGFAFA